MLINTTPHINGVFNYLQCKPFYGHFNIDHFFGHYTINPLFSFFHNLLARNILISNNNQTTKPSMCLKFGICLLILCIHSISLQENIQYKIIIILVLLVLVKFRILAPLIEPIWQPYVLLKLWTNLYIISTYI